MFKKMTSELRGCSADGDCEDAEKCKELPKVGINVCMSGTESQRLAILQCISSATLTTKNKTKKDLKKKKEERTNELKSLMTLIGSSFVMKTS